MQGTQNYQAAQSAADHSCNSDHPEHPDNSTRCLLEMLHQALQWPDDKFQRCYQQLVAQIECDCRRQEEWLELLPSAFSRQHLEEHARMLSVMHHTALCVMQGDIATGRSAVFLLADWIRVHAETMDKPMVAEILNERSRIRRSGRGGRLKNDLIDIG